MPAAHICTNCGESFQRARGLRRHVCRLPDVVVSPPAPRPSPGLTPPRFSIDLPETATHREVAIQTSGPADDAAAHPPLNSVTPARRISRARRQLIRPLLNEAISSTVDVGVGTHWASSDTHSTTYAYICTPQVPDMHPAPNHELAYVQDATRRMPELIGRLCRCRTCVRHSWWARRRMGNRVIRASSPPPLELTTLPPFADNEASTEDRRRLRQIHHDHPTSVLCICSCYSCVEHRVLDYAAQAVARRSRTPAPPEGGGCRDPRPTL